jgi:CRP-like cAMP-binding protein
MILMERIYMAVEPNMLRNIPLFEDMDEETRYKLSRLMNHILIQEGDVLTQQDEVAHSFYVILAGNYMVYFKNGRALTLHERGQIIGWSSIVTPFKYTASAVALTRGEALSMSSADFRQLLQEDNRISEKMMLKISAIISKRMPLITGTKSSLGL